MNEQEEPANWPPRIAAGVLTLISIITWIFVIINW